MPTNVRRLACAALLVPLVVPLFWACGDDEPRPPDAGSTLGVPGAPAGDAPATPPTPAGPASAATPEPRGLRRKEAGAFDGYTLIAPLSSRSVYLVDLDGKPVHEWKTAHLQAGGAYLLPNGHLLRCARDEKNPRSLGGGIGGLTQEIDWDGNVVWECDLVAQGVTQHHDLEALPNGNVLLLVREFHDHAAGLAVGRDPSFRRTSALWSDVVIEVEPVRPSGAKVVWTWRAWDHLVQDFDAQLPRYANPAEFPGRIDVNADHRFLPKKVVETPEARAAREALEARMAAVGYAGGEVPDDATAGTKPAPESNPLATPEPKTDAPDPRTVPKLGEDWLHTNGIDYDAERGLIALSSPRISEVYVIERTPTSAEAASESGGRYGKGGALLYRWGNPQSYALGGPDDRRLYYQHDVTWLASPSASELRFLVFNNGQKRPVREYSSVEEVHVPFDATSGFAREAGKPFAPRDAAWTYSDPEHFYAGFISGAQRLPNGNTLVCEGSKGRVFEVTRDGKIVWDFWSPFDDPKESLAPPAALFQAQRIGKDDPALRGRF